MPYAAALHSLNILISAYPICFRELSRIVDEYLEPEQSWRKRYAHGTGKIHTDCLVQWLCPLPPNACGYTGKWASSCFSA
jgi:hypothetical protein